MATVNRQAHVIAAKIVTDSGVIRQLANRVMVQVRGVAEQHRNTGNYIRHLKVVDSRGAAGVTDSLVVNDDPAVGAIEFGRIEGDRRVRALRIMSRGLARVR
jgi:hypothetical protein